MKRYSVSVLLIAGLVGGGGSASAATFEHSDASAAAALAQLRAELAERVSDRVDGAPEQLRRFDALTANQKTVLTDFVLGKSPYSEVGPSATSRVSVVNGTTVATEGPARWVTDATEEVESVGVRGATYNVHSSANQTFTLAGITISKTRVWGDYKTGSGVVKSITDYGCQVVSSIDPFSQISTSRQSKVLSSGKATFKCNVIVRRGVPTPWGQISTTTKSAYQYMRVNGARIEAQGWS